MRGERCAHTDNEGVLSQVMQDYVLVADVQNSILLLKWKVCNSDSPIRLLCLVCKYFLSDLMQVMR